MPDAYVTRFDCIDFVNEVGSLISDKITKDDCYNNINYNSTKFVDCHCKTEEKYAAMATLRPSYL